jgi:hypothetical protein
MLEYVYTLSALGWLDTKMFLCIPVKLHFMCVLVLSHRMSTVNVIKIIKTLKLVKSIVTLFTFKFVSLTCHMSRVVSFALFC